MVYSQITDAPSPQMITHSLFEKLQFVIKIQKDVDSLQKARCNHENYKI